MNKRPVLICALFLSGLILTACVMPETKIYSIGYPGELSAIQTKGESKAYVMAESPRHLSQPYIVFRTSPYELTVSKYSKWEAPPSELVRDAVRDALASSGSFSDVKTSPAMAIGGVYNARVHLKKFERIDAADGSSAELAFDISLLSPDGKEIYRNRVNKTVKLVDKEFANLAKALSGAVSEAAKDISKGVSEALLSKR